MKRKQNASYHNFATYNQTGRVDNRKAKPVKRVAAAAVARMPAEQVVRPFEHFAVKYGKM